MKKSVVGKFGRFMLWFSPIVIVTTGFVVALPWLKQQNAVVIEVTSTVASILVMSYGLFLAKRLERGLDEVQIASQGFAYAKGWVWGAVATAFLLMVPPVMSGLVDLVNAVVKVLGTGSPDMTHQAAVRLAFFCGFALVMLMQMLAFLAASLVWWRRMGGMREQS
jgi:hypothetical protein